MQRSWAALSSSPGSCLVIALAMLSLVLIFVGAMTLSTLTRSRFSASALKMCLLVLNAWFL